MTTITQLDWSSGPHERAETMVKSVYLDYTSHTNEYYLDEQGYREVRALVMKLRICASCRLPYDTDAGRPCVGCRICMECLLKKHPSMKFLAVHAINDEGECTYAFIDPAGIVFTSQENSSDDVSKDIAYSLRQHGFTPPTAYKSPKSSESARLHSSYFVVYGDLKNSSVLVIEYNDYYSKIHVLFLLYRHAGYKELTKRGEGKVLFERAQAMLEQTKNGDLYYVDGQVQRRISEGDIYRVISRMESAMYDISLQFAPPVQSEPVGPDEETARTSTDSDTKATQEEAAADILVEHEDQENQQGEHMQTEEQPLQEETIETPSQKENQESEHIEQEIEPAEAEKPRRGKRLRLAVVPDQKEPVAVNSVGLEERGGADDTQSGQDEAMETQQVQDTTETESGIEQDSSV